MMSKGPLVVAQVQAGLGAQDRGLVGVLGRLQDVDAPETFLGELAGALAHEFVLVSYQPFFGVPVLPGFAPCDAGVEVCG